MSSTALSLVLLAGLIHALWNIAAKKAGGDVRFVGLTALFMAIIWAPVGWWFARGTVNEWGITEWGLTALSGILHVLYFITLLRGYRKADLTVVYPIARGSGPLISAFIAIVFLDEILSFIGGLGILAVVIGVFFIAGGPKILRLMRLPHDERHAPEHRRIYKGLSYGFLTGIFIAAYTVLDAYMVKILLISPILIDYFGNFTRIAILIPALLRDVSSTLASWRQEWKYALIVATISPISYVLVLYAVQSAPISHVAPAREVSMLFAALIGGHLFDEGDRVPRILGAICIAIGVIALGTN